MLKNQDSFTLLADQAALLAVADDLKTPLIQIAYLAELGSATKNTESFDRIQLTASNALAEIDSLLLGIRATQGQLELPLMTIAPSAILVDAAQSLQKTSRQYQTVVELDVKKHCTVAMVHPQTLKHAVCALSQLLMKIGQGYSSDPRLVLRAIGTGEKPGISLLYRAEIKSLLRDIQNRSRQTITSRTRALLTDGPAAGYRVTDQLLAVMGARVSIVSKGEFHGFHIALSPSAQLDLLV